MALTDKLSAIGDAIRNKTGGTSKLTLDQMATEIGTIQSGEIIEVESHDWEDWYLSSFSIINEYENDRIAEVRQYGFAGCNIRNISLPNVVSVGIFSFNNSTQLKTINLPKCNKFLGGFTFQDCTNLEVINAPLITKLDSNTFTNCFKLENINMPNLVSISDSCFSYCYALKFINFPYVESTGINSFYNCNSIVNVDLPNLTTIGDSCFYGCSALENINIPLVTSLKAQEFNNCKALKKLDLPSVTTLSSKYSFGNYGPFSGCSALETVILRNNSVATLEYSNIFADTLIASGTGYVYVPASLVDSYKTATNWVTIADQIRAIEDYPDICG